MEKKDDLGKIGEEAAQLYLIKKGYKILALNWRFGHKELDIVALQDDVAVVVEVKSRSTKHFEHPKDAVTRKKQKRLVEAADAFIQQNNINFEVRFDIISVLPDGDSYKIEHIEDAFYPLV